MLDPMQIEGLEIVGYADALTETMVPSVVPPVFRSKQLPHRFYLPPYHMNAGLLYNASEVSQIEVDGLEHSEEITIFSAAPLNARRDYELWIDQERPPTGNATAFAASSPPPTGVGQAVTAPAVESISAIAREQGSIAINRIDAVEAGHTPKEPEHAIPAPFIAATDYRVVRSFNMFTPWPPPLSRYALLA